MNPTDFLPVLRDRGLVPHDALAVFVVGSVARGWAHAASDIDLVVVSPEPMERHGLRSIDVPLDPGVLPVAVFEDGGRRWEVKFWSDDQVDQLVEKVGWAVFEDQDRVANVHLAEVEQLFLERLPTCAPLSGDSWVRRRRAQLDASAFRTLLVTSLLARSDVTADAAMGLLAVGESEGAVVAVREAFGHAVDALLVGAGEYGALVKWRPRRFRLAEQDVMPFTEYWSIETMRDYDPDDPAPWVKTVFARCKDLAAEIEI